MHVLDTEMVIRGIAMLIGMDLTHTGTVAMHEVRDPQTRRRAVPDFMYFPWSSIDGASLHRHAGAITCAV